MEIGLKRKLEYADLPDEPSDGKRFELVRGGLYVTPSPTPAHQRISKRLGLVLAQYFEGRSIGELFHAPTDVILTSQDVFVPDLLVVSEPTHVSKRGIECAPLLIVEILSPSTRNRDRGIKARRYAELGVEHYWLVDPQERRIECYRSAGGAFGRVVEAEGETLLRHPDFDGLRIDLGALWR